MQANSNNKRNYLYACIFFIIHIFISSCNDVLTQMICGNIPFSQALAMRFFASTALLIPFWLADKDKFSLFKSPILHTMRGAILCVGLFFFYRGLSKVHVSIATTINFAIPLFSLVLAKIFLKEHITMQKLFATFIGFLGILIVINPTNSAISAHSIYLVGAAFCFASLDIVNKKFVIQQSMLSMMVGSSIVCSIIIAPIAISAWVEPSVSDIVLSLVLGAGANLILYFILKAFKFADVSALSPLRYLELPISSILSYIIFHDLPNIATVIGACIIIFSSLYIMCQGAKDKVIA